MQQIEKCQSMLTLINKLNDALSPFLLVHFTNCLSLAVVFSFIQSSILFAPWIPTRVSQVTICHKVIYYCKLLPNSNNQCITFTLLTCCYIISLYYTCKDGQRLEDAMRKVGMVLHNAQVIVVEVQFQYPSLKIFITLCHIPHRI